MNLEILSDVDTLTGDIVVKCLIGRQWQKREKDFRVAFVRGDRKDARKSTRYEIMKAYSD